MCKEYNGWTNHETWAVALHLDNDQVLYEIARDYANIAIQNGEEGDNLNAYYLGETLQNWLEEDLLTLENIKENHGLWLMLTDIGSLYRVNWQEVANHYLDQVRESLVG